jgi:hypothetical protein
MVFKSSRMAEVLQKAIDVHELYLASYAIDEVKRIGIVKFSSVCPARAFHYAVLINIS